MDSKNNNKFQEDQNKAKKIVLLGALSFLLTGMITGIPAVFIGHRELSKLRTEKTIYTNTDRRVIVGGMILGYIGIILSLYLIVLVFAGFFGWNITEFTNISTQ